MFALVHGGQLGAWAYDRLIPALRERGADALAIDLPVTDPDQGAAEYASLIVSSLTGVTDDVVLVGHSMGGLITPLVPNQRDISRLVFVCAGYPEPGRSYFQGRAEQPGESVGAGPGLMWQQPGDFNVMSPEMARELFFHDCPPDVQDWAISRLRPQARRPLREVTPLNKWPDTQRTLVIATEDRCIPRASAIRTADRLFGERPIELPTGHCPGISRPDLLADLLVTVAGT